MPRKRLPTTHQDHRANLAGRLPAQPGAKRSVDTLASFMADNGPDGRFTRFLAALGIGASLASAAASVRLNPTTLSKWIAKGKERRGMAGELVVALAEAISQPAILAENQLATKQPKQWLQQGPYSQLLDSNQWQDKPTEQPDSEVESVPNTPVDFGAVLLELHRAGIITLHQPGTDLIGLPSAKPADPAP